MLILWPWQRADHIAGAGEGSHGGVESCSHQILMTCSNAHLKPLARTRPLILKEKQSVASSRGGSHKWLHGTLQRPQQCSTITTAPVSEAPVASAPARFREWAEKISLCTFESRILDLKKMTSAGAVDNSSGQRGVGGRCLGLKATPLHKAPCLIWLHLYTFCHLSVLLFLPKKHERIIIN